MTDHSTLNLHPHSNEWRLNDYLGEAEVGNAECLNHLSHVVLALAGEPDVKAALTATMEAHQAALESKAALVGVRKFWGHIIPRVAKHPRIFGGTALAAFALIAVAWMWWPTAASAGVNDMPPIPLPTSAEGRAMRFIEERDFFNAERVIDLEMQNDPRGYYLHGLIEFERGDERMAQLWFSEGSIANDTASREALAKLRRKQ